MVYIVISCISISFILGLILAVIVLGNSRKRSSSGTDVDGLVSLVSAHLGDQLAAGKYVIERERDVVVNQVADVNLELKRVSDLMNSLRKEQAEQSGQFHAGIEHAFRATSKLTDTTQSLREVLGSSKARGQWGERMAEDVLQAAGFTEGINYVKQSQISSGGIPDFRFNLPKGHSLHMDVKFPLDNYRKWFESTIDLEKIKHGKIFSRDVRQRVSELAERGYEQNTLSYTLLFVPNESVYAFLHEHDPNLIDFSLKKKVVLCSPVTLFAVLAIVRQSVENFLFEKRSDEVLLALEGLRYQWERWQEPIDKMRRGLDSAQKAFDDLSGVKYKKLEREIEKLEQYKSDMVS